MTEIVKHNWFKDRRFWILWVIQAVVVAVVLVLNLPAVFGAVFINAGWSDVQGYIGILTAVVLSYLFIPQLLVALLYKRDNFLVLGALVLSSLIYSAGFSIALAMWLVDKSAITRFRRLAVTTLSVIVWWIFVQLIQLIAIVFVTLLIKMIPPTIAA